MSVKTHHPYPTLQIYFFSSIMSMGPKTIMLITCAAFITRTLIRVAGFVVLMCCLIRVEML